VNATPAPAVHAAPAPSGVVPRAASMEAPFAGEEDELPNRTSTTTKRATLSLGYHPISGEASGGRGEK